MQGRPLTPAEVDTTRRRLVELARALVEAEGREACSLRRVATEAGMSRSTPYSYFADKDALLDAVRASALDLLTERTGAAVAAAGDLAGRVRALGQAYLAFAFRHPALYDLLFEPRGPDGPGEATREAAARYAAVTSSPLAEAGATGLSTLPPERLARVLWAATHGLVSLQRAGKVDDFDAALADLREVLAFGFVPRGPS